MNDELVLGIARERLFDDGDFRPWRGVRPDGAERVQTEMKAGDVLFFHGSLVHGSRSNRSADRFRRSLIFHYVPQSSVEIARFYLPLVAPSGDEVLVAESPEGGPCGVGWNSEGH